MRARRPSKQERHWVLNTVLTGGLCYIGYVTAKHLQDGSLQRKYTSIRDYVGALTTEHIIEPITKLGEEFFDKLHRREGIVSREDLVQSREALTRMLEDFSKHGQRSYDIRQMMRGAAFMPSGFNDSDSSTSHENSAVNTVKTTGNPVGNSSHDVSGQNIALANETAAMESLMRTYEKQLQSPIYGMLYGNLMTAMLIQMQKLKGIILARTCSLLTEVSAICAGVADCLANVLFLFLFDVSVFFGKLISPLIALLFCYIVFPPFILFLTTDFISIFSSYSISCFL